MVCKEEILLIFEIEPNNRQKERDKALSLFRLREEEVRGRKREERDTANPILNAAK